MSVKEQIAKILNIKNDSSWDILDGDDQNPLRLIHYRDSGKNKLHIPHVRGLVLDLAEKRVVCDSYGYTPVATVDELYNQVVLECSDGQRVTFSPETFEIFQGFEGTIIRMWKHGGEVLYSSHRKLDTSKSYYGDSPFFKDIFTEVLNGPKPEDLFQNEEDSSKVHTFIMVHPTLLNASKIPIEKGFLVYLTSKDMKTGVQFKDSRVQTTSILPPYGDPSMIYTPKPLSVSEANQILKYGFHPNRPLATDKRLQMGEFIILKSKDKIFKVQSPAYGWRSDIRDNDPNITHRFYTLLDDRTSGLILSQPKNVSRTTHVYKTYFEALPLPQQVQALELLEQRNAHKETLLNWLVSIRNRPEIYNNKTLVKEPVRVLLDSVSNITDRKTLRKVIKAKLDKTPGTEFYKMISSYRRSYRNELKEAEKQATHSLDGDFPTISEAKIREKNPSSPQKSPPKSPTSILTSKDLTLADYMPV